MDSDRLPLLEGPQTVRRFALRKCSSAAHSGGPRERIPGTTDRVDFLWRLSENRLKKSIKTIDSRPQMSGSARLGRARRVAKTGADALLGAPLRTPPIIKPFGSGRTFPLPVRLGWSGVSSKLRPFPILFSGDTGEVRRAKPQNNTMRTS